MVQGEEWSQFDLPFRARLPPRSTQSSDQQASRLKEVEIAKIRSFQGNTDHGAHPGYVSSDPGQPAPAGIRRMRGSSGGAGKPARPVHLLYLSTA